MIVNNSYSLQSVGVGFGSIYPSGYTNQIRTTMPSIVIPLATTIVSTLQFDLAYFPDFLRSDSYFGYDGAHPILTPETIGPDQNVVLPTIPGGGTGPGVSVAGQDEEKTVIVTGANFGDGPLWIEAAAINNPSVFLPVLRFEDGENNEKVVHGIYAFMRARNGGGTPSVDVSAAPSLGGNLFPAALEMPARDSIGAATYCGNMGESRSVWCVGAVVGNGTIYLDISQDGHRFRPYKVFTDGENNCQWDPNHVYIYARVRRVGGLSNGTPSIYISGENASNREGGA